MLEIIINLSSLISVRHILSCIISQSWAHVPEIYSRRASREGDKMRGTRERGREKEDEGRGTRGGRQGEGEERRGEKRRGTRGWGREEGDEIQKIQNSVTRSPISSIHAQWRLTASDPGAASVMNVERLRRLVWQVSEVGGGRWLVVGVREGNGLWWCFCFWVSRVKCRVYW